MLVQSLKKYIKEHPAVSITELQQSSGLDLISLRRILNMWVNKGKLDQFTPGNVCGGGSCSSCGHCMVLDMELYTWVSSK